MSQTGADAVETNLLLLTVIEPYILRSPVHGGGCVEATPFSLQLSKQADGIRNVS
jgi:hypothetical protein